MFLPIAAWVGRWVAAIRLTATARPSRASESASPCAASGSSAYSSTMMTSAGSSGVGSQTRFPSAAIRAARSSKRLTASRNSWVAWAGVNASRSKQLAQGWSSMPPFMSIPHSTTFRQAARLAIIKFRTPDFPDPIIPPTRTLRRSTRTRTGWPSSVTPISIGLVTEVIHRLNQDHEGTDL